VAGSHQEIHARKHRLYRTAQPLNFAAGLDVLLYTNAALLKPAIPAGRLAIQFGNMGPRAEQVFARLA